MAVTVDAKCTADTVISGVTGTTGKTSTNLTVGASATALFAVLVFDGSADLTTFAMHWDSTGTNVAMTQIGSTVYVASVGQIVMFGLVSPVSGAKTLKATWSGTGTGYMASMSFKGSITSSVASCFTNATTATPTGTTGSITITGGATGGYSVAAVGNDDTAYTTVINATGSTNLFSDTSENYAGAAYAPNTGSLAYSWATSSSEQSIAAGCNVVQASSGTNANVTGVNATGGVGTVIPSVAPNDTGVNGTGAAGTITSQISPGALTGVNATGAVGSPLSSIGSNDTGAAGTGGVGSLAGSTGGTMGGVGGTGGVGVGTASIGANVGGAAGTGVVGVLGTPGTVNGTIVGVGGTGQCQGLSDEIDVPVSGVGATGYAGTLTTDNGSTPVVPVIVAGGPGDSDEAEAARQKWLEWSRKKRQKEKAKLAKPEPVAKTTIPAEVPIPAGQSLLERNLHAQRLQIMQATIAAQEAAEAQRLQDEDDEEAIALLMDA
jgi:hypothetical protein